jgi:hypothetical protein
MTRAGSTNSTRAASPAQYTGAKPKLSASEPCKTGNVLKGKPPMVDARLAAGIKIRVYADSASLAAPVVQLINQR